MVISQAISLASARSLESALRGIHRDIIYEECCDHGIGGRCCTSEGIAYPLIDCGYCTFLWKRQQNRSIGWIWEYGKVRRLVGTALARPRPHLPGLTDVGGSRRGRAKAIPTRPLASAK